MNPTLGKDLALLLLRLCGLGLAYAHGWAKVVALASGEGARLLSAVAALGFPMPVVFAWAAGLSEFAGGILVALGLGTRIAAPFAAFTMLVAAFLRHHAHEQVLHVLGIAPVSAETLEKWGNPERALIYLICLLAISLLGPGRFSLDYLFGGKSKGGRRK